jgi:hypothetical protein
MAYSQYDNDTLTQTQQESTTQAGSDTTSFATTAMSNGTQADGMGDTTTSGWYTSTSSCVSDSWTATGQMSSTETGTGGDTLVEQGVYGNGSFALSSLVEQLGSQVTKVSQVTATQWTLETDVAGVYQCAWQSVVGANVPDGSSAVLSSSNTTAVQSLSLTLTVGDTSCLSVGQTALGSFANGSFACNRLNLSCYTSDSNSLKLYSQMSSNGTENDYYFSSASNGNNLTLPGGTVVVGAGSWSMATTDGSTFAATGWETLTQTSGSAATLQQDGAYAAGSFSFGGAVTFQQQSLQSVNDTQSLSTVLYPTVSSVQTMAYAASSQSVSMGYPAGTVNQTSNLLLVGTNTISQFSCTQAYDSWGLTQLGSLATGSGGGGGGGGGGGSFGGGNSSYSFTSVVYQETAGATVSALNTLQVQQGGTVDGTWTFAPSSNTVTGAGCYVQGAIVNSTQTVQDETTTGSGTLYEAGAYSNGTLSLSSYSNSSTGSEYVNDTLVQTNVTLQTVTQTGNLTGYGPGAPASPTVGTLTTVQSFNNGLTLTLDVAVNDASAQVGAYGNGSFSLSCCTAWQNDSATQSSTSTDLSSITQDGSYTGTFALGNQMPSWGSGTMHQTNLSTDVLQDERTLDVTLSSIGSVVNANGATDCNLSSWMLQQVSTDSMAESRQTTSVQQYTVNGGLSGTGTTTGSDSLSQYVGCTWTEQSAAAGGIGFSYGLTQYGGFTYRGFAATKGGIDKGVPLAEDGLR